MEILYRFYNAVIINQYCVSGLQMPVLEEVRVFGTARDKKDMKHFNRNVPLQWEIGTFQI